MHYFQIEGNLLECPHKYICHQVNCVSSYAAGIARCIFDQFPYSDIYSHREKCGRDELPLPGEEPGNIIVKGNGKDERFVINMLAQFYPGAPKYIDSPKDGFIARQNYFKRCLSKIEDIIDLDSVAFPYKIGCGIADGNWNIYEKLIDDFAKNMKYRDVQTFIYKLPR